MANELRQTTAGVAVGMNTNRGNVSPSRLYMVGKNMGKAAVTKTSTSRKYISGDEQEYGKTARKVVVANDCTVEAVFFVDSLSNPGSPTMWGEYHVIVKSEETGEFDLITLERFHTQNIDLGFEYKYDRGVLRSLQPGKYLKKGTVIGQSPRINKSGEWCPGVETKVAAMSSPYTEEDGVVMSESHARKVGISFRRKHNYSWMEDEWIPLNLYGTPDEPQPFPLEGQEIRSDGIIMGFRRKNGASLASLTKTGLMEPDQTYDHLFFGKPGSVVGKIYVETERYKNAKNNRSRNKPTFPHTQVLEDIERNYNNFNNRVVQWYLEKKKTYNTDVPLTPALWNFILYCRGNITNDFSTTRAGNNFNPVKRKNCNIPCKDWYVEIHIKEETPARVRFKNTGMDGNKSVIIKILPDECMPFDGHGNRADMIVGNTPAFKRQIFSSLMELDINFVNIHIWPRIKFLHEDGQHEKAFEEAARFYKAVSPQQYAMVMEWDAEQRIKHLDWITADPNEFCALGSNSDDHTGIKIIDALAKEYPDIKPTPVSYKNELGVTVTTLRPIVISSVYYVMLDKFGDHMSCQSMPKLNIFGLPASLHKSERSRDFYRAVLNRNMGEVEGRTRINQCGARSGLKAVTMANSPIALDRCTKRIIRADNPFLIENILKPNEVEFNSSLQVVENMLGDFSIVLRKGTCERLS